MGEWGRWERCIVLLKLRQRGVKEEGVCREQNRMSGEIGLEMEVLLVKKNMITK